MASNPSISIITPVWNGLPYLKECVQSVLDQDLQDWEMIISDDGSTDGAREYLDTVTDHRIRVYKQEKNAGIFGNLNFIFKNARAPISQILCQDDYFTAKDSLTTIVEYWKLAPDEIGFTRFNHNSVGQCSLTRLQKDIIKQVVKKDDIALWFFLFGNIPGNLSNMSLRTKIVSESGFFDSSYPYAGDFEFWKRASRLYDMGVQGKEVVYVRRHSGTASVSLNKKGELLSQKARINNDLYTGLTEKYRNVKFPLKLHGTINYDTLQRDTAVRLWFKGKKEYLYELIRVSKKSFFILPGSFTWLLFVVTLGGRLGRVTIAKYLLRSVNKSLNNDIIH